MDPLICILPVMAFLEFFERSEHRYKAHRFLRLPDISVVRETQVKLTAAFGIDNVSPTDLQLCAEVSWTIATKPCSNIAKVKLFVDFELSEHLIRTSAYSCQQCCIEPIQGLKAHISKQTLAKAIPFSDSDHVIVCLVRELSPVSHYKMADRKDVLLQKIAYKL